MKRERIAALLLAMLLLAGCANGEDPYRVDTVVYIPADPTQMPTEIMMQSNETAPEQTEAVPAETQQSSEETEAPETEPEATEAAKKSTSTKKTTSSKKTTTGKKTTSSKKDTTTKKDTSTKATEPPASKPAATEPPATEAPATEVPATQPAATEPPATEPPATEPPVTEPEPTDPPLYDISGYKVGSLESGMRDAINGYRTEAGLSELSMSSRLCAIASCRGYEISQVWSHTRPDGRSYKTVLSDYGYGGGSVKELLVYVSGSGDGAAIVDKWMSSDSHRELLLGGYSTVGIGTYRANGNTYIACLLVG